APLSRSAWRRLLRPVHPRRLPVGHGRCRIAGAGLRAL
ncbi:MAG: hypothetical protein AVDCRST_MAG67-3623, partial [uncultured Solirubrobacteraceae bacterium]